VASRAESEALFARARIGDARSAARFLVVGAGNAALSFCIYRAVLHVLPPAAWRYTAAFLGSYVPGILYSYVLNRRWSFEATNASGALFFHFLASQVALAVVSGVCVVQLRAHTPLSDNLSWVLVAGAVTALNYLTLRHLVFRRR